METDGVQLGAHLPLAHAELDGPARFVGAEHGDLGFRSCAVDQVADGRDLSAHARQLAIAAVLLPAMRQDAVGVLLLAPAALPPAEEVDAADAVADRHPGPQPHPSLADVHRAEPRALLQHDRLPACAPVVVEDELRRARRVVVHPVEVDGRRHLMVVGVLHHERLKVGRHPLAGVEMVDQIGAPTGEVDVQLRHEAAIFKRKLRGGVLEAVGEGTSAKSPPGKSPAVKVKDQKCVPQAAFSRSTVPYFSRRYA